MSRRKKVEALDPQVAQYLKAVRSRPPAYLLSVEELRRDIDQIKKYYPPEPVKNIKDILINGPDGKIAIRIYTPGGKGPFTPVVFYHGGGWSIGSLNSHEGICASLANKAKAAVFSVNYRLAPEDPFPAAVDDCYAALEYVNDNAASFNADPGRMIVMGDSAGGNLAAVVSMKAKEEGGPKIALQVLVYPATNMKDLVTSSYKRFGKGYDLDKKMIAKFRDLYILNKKDIVDPRASPFFAKDLKGLPPTLLITAECDPLRDDGKKFASKLKKAGVPVKYIMYKGVIHGFLSFTTFHVAQKALSEIARTLGIFSKRRIRA